MSSVRNMVLLMVTSIIIRYILHERLVYYEYISEFFIHCRSINIVYS